MLYNCSSIFSSELPKNVTVVGDYALEQCFSLRNVAFPPNAVFGDHIFGNEGVRNTNAITDLQQLFGSGAAIIRELQHRFDRLPIHKLVYYQSYYHEGVLQRLIAETNSRSCQRRTLRSKLNLTDNQQDCLGMTSLHILTCSSVHNLEVYRFTVAKYPANLITEDRWGALPLLYAFWGGAPVKIIEFLLESYQSLYPDYSFNWTMMVETMGRTDTPKESIENLLHVRRMHFPEQPIDWEYLLDEFVNLANPSDFCFPSTFAERMQFLFICGMSLRVESLAIKVWRDHIRHLIQTANFKSDENNSIILRSIQEKLAHLEDELPKLKEATTILELALWKMNICDTSHKQKTFRRQKEIKVEGASPRQQCRVTCGADVIIGHVMPYLISRLPVE